MLTKIHSLRVVAVPVVLYFEIGEGEFANSMGIDGANETIRELTRKFNPVSDLLDYSVNEPTVMRIDLGDNGYQEDDCLRGVVEHTFSDDELQSLGYQVCDDQDLPGMFYWRRDGEGSEISFPTRLEAIRDAAKNAASIYELSRCQNCDKLHSEQTIVEEIPDFSMRVNPGEPTPSGQCPDCGALCHRINP